MPQIKKATKTKVKRKRKRKKHYITGIHHSPKCPTPIKYRSGWELTVALYLDQNPEVLLYEYESINIRYAVAGRYRTYTPDFLIVYKDGKKVIVEVKRADKLTDRKVIAKATATRKWLKENKLIDYDYQFWTNAVIEGFKKLLEAKK
jgi:hypothetical protein